VTKYDLGYVIYGCLGFFGVVVPSAVAYALDKDAPFPTFFWTVARLQRRAHWVATLVVAGLAVLVFHLALYPWPDLP
jgi:hypothetical protein